MAEAASEGDERITALSSRVTYVRGYPAIIAESKRTSSGKASFVIRGELFIGLFRVRLISTSSDRAEAKRNFDEFADAMEIVDVEPGQPAEAPEPPPPSALDGPPDADLTASLQASDASRCNCLIIERRAGGPDDRSVEPSLRWIAVARRQ